MRKIASFISALSLLLIAAAGTSAKTWIWGRAGVGYTLHSSFISKDPFGNVFTAVYSAYDGTANPANSTFGPLSIPLSTDTFGSQVILIKYDSDGNALWAQASQYADAFIADITTDKYGNSYLFGSFQSDSIKFASATLFRTPYPILDITYFLVKFDPSGNLVWAKTGGAAGLAGYQYSIDWGNGPQYQIVVERPGGIVVDTACNIYLTSAFEAPTSTIGNFTLVNAGIYNTFLAKYDSQGNVVWATIAGENASNDFPTSLAITPAGNLYISGVFVNSIVFGTDTLINTGPIPSGESAFIAEYNSSGTLLWAAKGTTDSCFAYITALKADSANNIYLVGGFAGSLLTFDTTTADGPVPGRESLYMAKLSPSNHVKWYKTIYDSTASVYGYDLSISDSNKIWISGSFNKKINIGSKTLSAPPGSPSPLFIAGFDTSGNYIAGAVLPNGGSLQSAIVCGTSESVYLSSTYSQSTPFIVAADTLLPTAYQANFLAKYHRPFSGLDSTFILHDTTICSGSHLLLSVPPGDSSYHWNNGASGNTLSVSTPGTYWVVIDLFNGEGIIVDTFKVVQRITANLSFSLGADTASCHPVVLSIPLSGVSYLWQNGTTDSLYIASATGVYYATVSNNGCSNSDTISVTINDFSQHLRDTALCSGLLTDYTLYANVPPGATALWSTGSTASSITVSDTGTYWVTVSDGACMGTDTMTLSTTICDCAAFLPAAFTPNNDGKNDHLKPLFQTGCNITAYSLTIYNRWGQLVFSGHSPLNAWDGTFQASPAPLGVYMYYLSYKAGTNNTQHTQKGDITLIR